MLKDDLVLIFNYGKHELIQLKRLEVALRKLNHNMKKLNDSFVVEKNVRGLYQEKAMPRTRSDA